MKKNRLYNTIFIFFLLILLLPLSQQISRFPKVAGLKGYFVKERKPVYSTINFKNGAFQDSLTRYVENNIGYRSDLVRINNTLDFRLFNVIHAHDVIFGKKDYLFEIGYIDSALGHDFLGEEEICEKVKKAKYIQDCFRKMDKSLVIIVAPGKGAYHKELIPDEYFNNHDTITNYEVFIDKADQIGLSLLDFHGWFLSMKDTTSYPLYPPYGIHWSQYGMIRCFDSLVDYLSKNGNYHLRDFDWYDVSLEKKYDKSDYDLGRALNIFGQIKGESLGYPKVKYGSKEGCDQPSLIAISDSYFWSWYSKGYISEYFTKGNFLYYYNELYGKGLNKPLIVEDLDRISLVLEHDITLVMATEGNLKIFAYGFIDEMYDFLLMQNNEL